MNKVIYLVLHVGVYNFVFIHDYRSDNCTRIKVPKRLGWATVFPLHEFVLNAVAQSDTNKIRFFFLFPDLMWVDIGLAKKSNTLTKPLKLSVYNLEIPVQSSISSVVMAPQTKLKLIIKRLNLFRRSLYFLSLIN